MKSSAYFMTLALATVVVASPTKKSKCGSGHHPDAGYPVKSYSESSLPYSSLTQGYPIYTPSSSTTTSTSTTSASTTSESSTTSAAGTICTATSTTVETDTVTSTIIPETTTSVSTVTETSTTTTTLDQSTSTFTSTSTVFETNTVTETDTETDTATTTTEVTTTPATSTVGAGYTPIQSVLSPNAAPSKRGEKRQRTVAALEARGTVSTISPGDVPICTSTVSATATSTSTVTSTTQLETPSTTVTETSTVISTSTELLTPASSTTTITSTSQVETTTTVTTTSTTTTTETSTTTVGPTPTVYPACQDSSNYISTYLGRKISDGVITFYGDVDFLSATSPTDCCTKCHASHPCTASMFTSDGTCYAFYTIGSQTCSPSQRGAEFITSSSEARTITINNGGCGQWAPDTRNSS